MPWATLTQGKGLERVEAVCTGRGRTARTGGTGGVFAQRAHSANYYVVYPRNTPENHPPTEACIINPKQHGVQNSRPWDPWPPVVENFSHGAPCVPKGNWRGCGGRGTASCTWNSPELDQCVV